MKFKSTRGGEAGVGFEAAVLSGRPADGGMYVPESPPRVSRERMKRWSHLSYPQLVEEMMRLFVDPEEMSDQELKGMS